MTYRILLTAAAVNGTVFGLLFIVVPDAAISLFGGRLDQLGLLLVRQFGGVILGLAWLDWLIRRVEDPETRRAVVVGNVAAFVVVAVTAAIAVLVGAINPLGWVVAGFHAVVALGLLGTLLRSRQPFVDERAVAVAERGDLDLQRLAFRAAGDRAGEAAFGRTPGGEHLGQRGRDEARRRFGADWLEERPVATARGARDEEPDAHFRSVGADDRRLAGGCFRPRRSPRLRQRS